jgi:hypothetical protein
MRTQSGLLACMTAAVVSMAASGCGSNSDPVSGPQYTYPDVGTYCAARAKAECSTVLLDNCSSTQAACVATRQGLCGQAVPPGVNTIPPTVTYRPAQADACIAAVAAAYTDDKVTEAELAAIDKACSQLFEGVGVANSPCTGDADCNLDAQFECVKPTGSASGTCQIPKTVDPGGDCSSADSVCKDGYFCSAEAQGCLQKYALGKACNDQKPCQDTLVCVPTAPPAPDGTCQAKLDVASPCTCPGTQTWCESVDCAGGLCSAIAGNLACASQLKLSPNEPICGDFR